MSVKSGAAAYEELLFRLGHKPADDSTWDPIVEEYPFVRGDPPDGFTVEPLAAKALWVAASPVPPLRDPAAYELGGQVNELNKPPAQGLATSDAEARQAYCDSSIDITMRGGTTLGVVYPMAVCELAREYRLRNIGGASAGAIAAAASAAAEAGRSVRPEEPAEIADDAARSQGHVRAGFAGFADCMAWLAQVDDPGSDEFRVGQLFRPTQPSLPLFRLVVAYMRRRYLAIPLLFAGAFGKVSKWANIVIAMASLVMAGLWPGRDKAAAQYQRGSLLSSTHADPAHPGWNTVVRYAYALAQGAVGLIALTVLVVGTVAVVLLLAHKQDNPPDEMDEPVLAADKPAPEYRGPAGLLAGGVAGLFIDAFVFGIPLLQLLAVWLFTIVALVVVAIVSVLWLVLGAERHSFGMVSGSSPKVGRSLWNWVAGLPKATVDRPLVCWLSETISELAGLDAKTPLRFGHLWLGREYQPPKDAKDAKDTKTAEAAEALAKYRRAADDPAQRLVNLELVTTELVQGLSYKFPLPPGDELEAQVNSALYVRRQDLEASGAALFPRAVIDALCAAPALQNVYDRRTGEHLADLHQLPEPWDLPVIFAVRLSMSLPALLEAVRAYRISQRPSIVRDEFGLPIRRGSAGRLEYPVRNGKWWAEELWFSDGGITSNFPIHLFDSLFPMWPTVGITLSPYHPGLRHQDVWLPQDWQGHQVIGAPVSGGMTGFIGAIIDAARGWRDTAQSQMPSYVGRIATVRQSKTEGGTNLFMPKETIAALALRGELAGARLRRRFRSPWWRRNQWLRFRTSIGNLEGLREEMRVTTTRDPYRWLASDTGSDALKALQKSLTMGDPDTPYGWWSPGSAAYWASAQKLTAAIDAIPAASELNDGVPEPEPELREVPPA